MKRKQNFHKKNNFRIHTSEKRVSILPRIGVIFVVLVLLIGALLYYQFVTVGQAIKGQNLAIFAPVLDLDIDTQPYVDFNFKESPSVNIFVTLSKIQSEMVVKEEYNLTLNEVKDELFKYTLVDSAGIILLTGLLDSLHVNSGPLYLNDDSIPDLQLEITGDIVEVTNLNYVLPEYSKIVMLNATMQQVGGTTKLFFNAKKDNIIYYFNVTSTKIPVVSAFWKGGSMLNSTEFSVVNSTANSTLMKLSYTFTEDKPYVLVINATVDDKTTLQQYVFAVGNVVYVLDETDTPGVIVKKIDNAQYNVQIMFRATENVQAFSLPCGSNIDFTSLPINVVYAYDLAVQQWKANVPSEFSALNIGKGYALKLNSAKESGFNYTCTQSGLETPVLMDLKSGWNLVGLQGYKSQTVAEFMKSVVPQQIKCIVVVGKNECMIKGDNLIPGKAYWVKVN